MGETLYYYCSSKVFESILDKKEVWLSDLTKSNDYAEISIYLDALMDAVQVKIDECYADHTKKAEIIFYKAARKDLSTIKNKGYFLGLCLTSLEDSLIHWRAYGDDGKGFAVGIDRDKLAHLRNKRAHNGCLHLAQVQYGIEARNNAVTSMIQKLEANIRDSKLNGVSDNVANVVRQWSNDVVIEAAHYKKAEFQLEAETRLCYCRIVTKGQMTNPVGDTLLEQIGLRITEDDCVPYMKFSFKDTPHFINHIIIGPENHSDEETIKIFIARKGIEDGIAVKKSKATHRGKNYHRST